MPEPVVTVWRNKIPHPCTLLHWGRKWRFIDGRPRRLVNLRRMNVWTAHAPVIGGETVVVDARGIPGWQWIRCYHADGSPIVLTGLAEVPDA